MENKTLFRWSNFMRFKSNDLMFSFFFWLALLGVAIADHRPLSHPITFIPLNHTISHCHQ